MLRMLFQEQCLSASGGQISCVSSLRATLLYVEVVVVGVGEKRWTLSGVVALRQLGHLWRSEAELWSFVYRCLRALRHAVRLYLPYLRFRHLVFFRFKIFVSIYAGLLFLTPSRL